MKILLIEWACSISFEENKADSSFYSEGKAMFMAVMEDLLQCGHQIVTVLREDLSVDHRSVQVHTLKSNKSLILLLKNLASHCDACVLIAPECGGILFEMISAIEDISIQHIGCSSAAVALCANKFQLHQLLIANGITTPETWLHIQDVEVDGPLVLKPLDGAGSEGIKIYKNLQELAIASIVNRPTKLKSMVIQQFVQGIPVSIACLVRRNGSILFMPSCGQIIGFYQGSLKYEGGWCPLARELHARTERLAKTTLAVVNGIFGWIGIDMILGESPDGSDDFVIEINPRLTTSYVGIRQLIVPSPVPWWINMENGPLILKDTWSEGVQWDKTGNVFDLGVH